MKTFFSILFCLCFTYTIYAQNLIRVNPNPIADADYTNLQTAIDSANAGDTIYVEGTIINSLAPLTKQLTFIGKGYFLDEQDSTYTSLELSSVGTINFSTTTGNPDGSKFIGLSIFQVVLTADNITFERCKINSISTVTQAGFGGNNCSIIQCHVTSLSSQSIKSNFLLRNSIVTNSFQFNGSPAVNCLIINNLIGVPQVSSNIGQFTKNCIFNNNIITGSILGTAATLAANNQFDNNVFVGSIPSNLTTNSSGNIAATAASLFVGGIGSDAQYQLSITSPAKGAGLGGVDCGPFGGSDPYVLSGLPNLGRIFRITTSYGTNINQMNVNVKATTTNSNH